MNPDAIIVNGGYLVRSVTIDGPALSLTADFNKSTPLEVIGAPKGVSKLFLNGKPLEYATSNLGNWVSTPDIDLPDLKVPDLSSIRWHYINSLPEIEPNYDDSAWTPANLSETFNSANPLRTSMSLYGGDYGFYAGTLIFRGHFIANGTENNFTLWTQGGAAYASSVWLNDQFLGSFNGNAVDSQQTNTYTIPKMTGGKEYILTILVDNTGLEENGVPGADQMKAPRGILDYALISPAGSPTSISWKVTGNLGGEDYVDKFRGPLNEGGLYFERQGYHLPGAPLDAFTSGSPYDGIDQAGVAFYGAKLSLGLPADMYDIPLSFVFQNSTSLAPYRALLFVNGFQFGRYVQNIAPQNVFPVPDGILYQNGDNWIGVAVWALGSEGAKMPGFTIEAGTPVLTGRQQVDPVNGPGYIKRHGAY